MFGDSLLKLETRTQMRLNGEVIKTTDLIRIIKNEKYRVISVADVEQNTQRKNVRHLNRNVEDVEILTTINPLAAPSSLLP